MQHSVFVSNKGFPGLNPLDFGYEDCEPGHFFGPAIRSAWVIHFVVSGCGIFRIDGKEYRLHAGEMFIIPPFVETYYEADRTDPWNYSWIIFTTNPELTPTLPPTLRLPEASRIFSAMKMCEAFSEGRSAYLAARLWDLFACIADKEAQHTDYVQSALDYIHNNYMLKITVGGIADKLNIDRTYFYTLFRKKIGTSPQQYLLDYRMNTAASLIRKQNVSVSIAGRSVGYTDLFTFSKMFKKHFGISPSQYAKENL